MLIGTVLDLEDRKITSKRFATAPEGARAARCALPIPAAGQKFARDSIAGVYIHATAVNNLVRDDGLIEFGRIGAAVSSFAFAALAATAALAFGPIAAAAATIGLAIAWIAGATVAFRHALVLPLIEPLTAGLAALLATIGYRFVVADKGKRLLRQSFGLYLAPAVIEKMLSSSKPPALGGEMRNVTVFFSDIAGFSSISEKMPPAELVALMNEYLSAMTDAIEAHGGFVDKYIGDAIVAVFGAPLDDPDHATHAVQAALRCAASLGTLERVNAAFGSTLAPAHRTQFRRGAGRQYRLAAALQLHGDGRHGEPRLAARRRQQVLRHDDRRLGGDGRADGRAFALARARRDPRQGPQPGGADFRAAGAARRRSRRTCWRARRPMPRA